ncbi:MAG: DUF1572 family protein [Sphingobacteriaceae bacterium]|nr:DUF1572 family protein [Sphingobacteriaceae bacterium]
MNSNCIHLFKYYKLLGEKTFSQLNDEQLFAAPNSTCNSISILVQHLWGNMMSRWTDFLNSDGEKEWRNRDEEFESILQSRDEMLVKWNEGWACLFKALGSLQEADYQKIIYIRKQGHTVTDAIHRQLAHYAYHVGQIVYAGKLIKEGHWESLSIPKNESDAYNRQKFSQQKETIHFTNEYLNKGMKE